MSDPNPNVSNGTCYTASGQKLDQSFIPCGNDAFGRQTCCGKGDNCLADGACFGVHGQGYGSMLTYWAGCSDPDYEDASCPKKVVDQPWVALTLCDNGDGEWAICSQKGNPSTLQPGAYCSCTDTAKATVAFKDARSLSNLVSLPQNTGDTMSFFGDYKPTATVPTASSTGGGQATSPVKTTSRTLETSTIPPSSPPAGTTTPSTSSPLRSSDSSSGSSSATTFTDANGRTTTATVTRTATSPNNTNAGSNTGNGEGGSDSESAGLDTGAKIGVGVGVAVGGVLLLALVLLLLRRRRSRPAKRIEEDGGAMPPPEPKVPLADSAAILEADGRPAKPHKLRGELGEGTAAVGRRPSNKLKSAHRPRPSDGSAVSELEGSLGGAGAGDGVVGARHSETAAPPADEGLATVAELPGTDVQGGNGNYGRRLASDDSLVPAPLQVHHGGEGGHAAPQASTASGPADRRTGGESQMTSDARVEGAQVKPWGARWRRT
ncbi:hypothetical protein PG994_014625 [Apiospora phragmitis]|uniref:Uncharacterized protein n=1 Tax=Apiospora phragmitis TaxID=2905665 RepID=A0ABR1T4V3_9PEZI